MPSAEASSLFPVGRRGGDGVRAYAVHSMASRGCTGVGGEIHTRFVRKMHVTLASCK